MSNPDPFAVFPEALRARLAAAGVTDAAQLPAAIAADPWLAQQIHAFNMQALLAAFTSAETIEDLATFWQHVPEDLEEAFIATLDATIATVEQSSDPDAPETAAALRERQGLLGEIILQFRAPLEPIVELLRAFLDAETDDELAAFWSAVPEELAAPFLATLDAQLVAIEASDAPDAAALAITMRERQARLVGMVG